MVTYFDISTNTQFKNAFWNWFDQLPKAQREIYNSTSWRDKAEVEFFNKNYRIKFKQMNIEIYTKNNCSFCVKAKNLLINEMYHFNEINIEDGQNKQLLFERVPNVKTVPQIFIDGEHIGGYTELVEYFNNLKNDNRTLLNE